MIKNKNHIKDYRKLLIKALGNKCQKCGATLNLVLHHKRYKDNLEMKDIELLCSKCHANLRVKRVVKAKQFIATVSSMGRKKMINVPAILNSFKPGDKVEVKKVT